MDGLKIRVFKGSAAAPEKTITIPLNVLRVASKLMPKQAMAALEENGIDLKQIVELSQESDVRGTLVEIEEHKKNKRIVIALE